MKKWAFIWLSGAVVLLTLFAWGGAQFSRAAFMTPTPIPPPDTQSNSLIDQLDHAEVVWGVHHLTEYEAEVLVTGVWGDMAIHTEVRAGIVTAQTIDCLSEAQGKPCYATTYDLWMFTIPNFFEAAHMVAHEQWPGLNAFYFTITFDPMYGFPSQGQYDDPNQVGEEWGWTIESFEVLAGTNTRELDKAEASWQAHPVNNYILTVIHTSVMPQFTYTIQLAVEDGIVVSATCTYRAGDFCANFDPNRYTVPGLFATAWESAGPDTALQFDPVYSFPTWIAHNDPQFVDEEWTIQVESFTPEIDESIPDSQQGSLLDQLEEAEATWQARHFTSNVRSAWGWSKWTRYPCLNIDT
jgi:hypothetical protein